MGQYMPIVWIGFAIFMLLCEGFTTQLVSIWFVLGSVCAAITTIFTSDITIQSAVFLVVSLVSLIVTRPLVKRFKKSVTKQREQTQTATSVKSVLCSQV